MEPTGLLPGLLVVPVCDDEPEKEGGVMDWKVGQTVYVHYFHRYNSHMSGDYAIERIGRKWAYLGGSYRGERFDIDTGRIDSGGASQTGQVWVSKSDWEQEQKREALCRRFMQGLPKYATPAFTIAQVTEAARILGINLEEEKT